MLQRKIHGSIEYYIKGSTPNLLIVSGMHGDEHEVIPLVFDYVTGHEQSLPDFLYIPKASPTAVVKKTRRNAWGRDINRQFFNATEDPEVKNFMELVSSYRFDLAIAVHEDPDRTNGFYIYDSGIANPAELAEFKAAVQKTGATLYSGVDDPFDVNLGLMVKDGYVSTPLETIPTDSGISWLWLLSEGICQRAIDPEIPGKASEDLKKKLVHATLSFWSAKVQQPVVP